MASLALNGSPRARSAAAVAALLLATWVVASLAPEARAQVPVRVRPPAAEATYADVLLARAEDAIRAARFEEAERLVRTARIELPTDADPRARIRTEIVEATVHVAFGRKIDAVACLERALDLAPALELDEAWSSPKLEDALAVARTQRERARGAARPAAFPD